MLRIRTGIILIGLLITTAAAAQQVVPYLINYQGRLMDSGGQSVTSPGEEMDFLIGEKDVSTKRATDETVFMSVASPLALAHQVLVPGSEVVNNVDYIPLQGNLSKMDASRTATQDHYDHLQPGLKKMFQRNGTLGPTGKVNEQLFQKEG